MKKVSFLLILFLSFLVFNDQASANEHENNVYPTQSEIEVLNNELQVLVEQANEKLAKGEENIEVSSNNLKLVFNQKELFTPVQSSLSAKASAVGSKSYQAYVANTAGFNFTHAVSGVFSWNGSNLTAVSKKADLTGPMYDKSHNTYTEGLDGTIGRDAKIARITSQGTFKALKYFANYYTTLVVDVYAPTKSYRIIEAKINS
ncbi:hypothetical protein [Bacillus wiedmannii]|uniref:hypothetical protein n=1 Tax=Bacillus wiedmannii TaxID=1890302 RepID=UPI0007DAED32|nr:hypothetical protein [Bacillus wiedmannii]OAK19321.1 hypothetical protein A6281_27260 [Bacillus wiedmannii]OAK21081.1 hypothetical protein A6282_27100 [Bacillus wiedmannii]